MVDGKPSIRLIPRFELWQNDIQDDIVNRLEQALTLAKEGEFDGVVILAHKPDGGNYTTYTKMVDRMTAVGMFEYVKWRLMRDYDE